MSSRYTRWLVVLAVVLVNPLAAASAEGWKAGVAKATISPRKPTWMAGYGSRDRPSEGTIHDLWAKALVLEGPSGRKAVLVTLDVCGIGRDVSLAIREAVKSKHGVPLERIVLACSHTHSGPVIGDNLLTMYPMTEEQAEVVREYTKGFVSTVGRVVGEALAHVAPAELAWETGRADFAVNRRNNKEADVPRLRAENALEGPVNHGVPVLRVRSAGGPVKAVVCGYACHCTVLSDYKFCGDYAGFAQIALERAYPGSQAMFVAGCGADQNPLPRRSIEAAERYGNELAESARRVVDAPMRAISSDLVAHYEEIPLRFAPLPSREALDAEARSTNLPLRNRAKKLLGALQKDGALSPTYPYPVQTWRLGDLTWVLLGGEVVVDYSLRIERNLGASRTWVSSYCNDVMAYIPSLRVLKEGGYEGATAMIYYGQPTSWSTDVERQIMESITRLLAAKPEAER